MPARQHCSSVGALVIWFVAASLPLAISLLTSFIFLGSSTKSVDHAKLTQMVAVNFVLLPFFIWESVVENSLRRHRCLRAVLILLFAFVTSAFLFEGNFSAQFGIIDDHEIMKFLGNETRLPLDKFFKEFFDTPDISGSLARFRPSYYILRLLETSLWGDSPFLWYLSRTIMFAVSLSLFVWMSSNLFGFVPTLLYSLFLLTFPFWAGVFCRLGPPEAYAMFGCALAILGFQRLNDIMVCEQSESVIDLRSKMTWLVLFTLGSFVAIGSKENMMFMSSIYSRPHSLHRTFDGCC